MGSGRLAKKGTATWVTRVAHWFCSCAPRLRHRWGALAGMMLSLVFFSFFFLQQQLVFAKGKQN